MAQTQVKTKRRSPNQRDVSKDECARISNVFKFLSHPLRIQLLLGLQRRGSLSVMELVEQSGMSQSQVSQTLQKLRMSGIVDSDRQGSCIYYRIRCEQLKTLLKRIEEIYPAI